MKAIILAAGQCLHLDGYHQLLVRDPKTNNTILDSYIEIFGADSITIVVGYRAIEIMTQYPMLEYVYNREWAVTNNSGSLGLIDITEPSFVLSSDLFISPKLIAGMTKLKGNVILTALREARAASAISCFLENNTVKDIYKGRVKRLTDPECLGVFKVDSAKMMSSWIKRCRQYPELFVAENLPLGGNDVMQNMDLGHEFFYEINSVNDYIHFLSKRLDRE